ELQRALEKRNEIGTLINEKGEENAEIGEKNARLSGEVTSLIQQGADATLQFSDNVNKVNGGLSEANNKANDLKDTLGNITLSPLEQSIQNSLKQMEKLFPKEEFDPFDLSKVSHSRVTPSTRSDLVTPENQVMVDKIMRDLGNSG